MIADPTATVAATGIMIAATAAIVAPLCAQGLMNAQNLLHRCVVGDWDKVISDLDRFGTFMSSLETVGCMAELAGGAAMASPSVSSLIEQLLSLRPVITSVQNASGETVQSLYVMIKNQLQNVAVQGVELSQLPELTNFNMTYKNIFGVNFFKILPKSDLAFCFFRFNIANNSK